MRCQSTVAVAAAIPAIGALTRAKGIHKCQRALALALASPALGGLTISLGWHRVGFPCAVEPNPGLGFLARGHTGAIRSRGWVTRQCLLEISDQIIDSLDTDRKAQQVPRAQGIRPLHTGPMLDEAFR